MDGVTVLTGQGNDANIVLANVLLFPSNPNHYSNYIAAGGLAK
jgi:hypothetical protein